MPVAWSPPVASGIVIERVGEAPVVNSNHLRLRGIGEILRSESVWEGKDETLVDVSAVITGDHIKIVDAEQLGERVAREKDGLEGKSRFLFLSISLFLVPG